MKDIRSHVRLLLFGTYSALILYLSLIPSPPEPSAFLSWDKLHHCAAFFLHAILAAFLFISFSISRKRALIFSFITAILFGALVEVLQGTMTLERRAEWGDLAADAIGAAAGSIIFIFLLPTVKPAKQGSE